MKLPRLREWRELRGKTQVELAEEAGRSSRSIAGYEAGAEARPNTARRLAEALGVEVIDLARQDDAEWEKAVDNFRRFRSYAKDRLRGALSAWRLAKEEGSSEQERRQYLDEVGEILQEAYDAEKDLLRNAQDGLDSMGVLPPENPDDAYAPNAYWEEVREASRLYGELMGMVQGAGLYVRPMKLGNAAGLEQHKVALEPAV